MNEEAAKENPATMATKHGLILICAPSEAAADERAETLRALGYRCETTGNPANAPDVAAASAPDVVLIEVDAAAEDPLAPARALKSDGRTRALPLVLIADELERLRKPALEAGVDDVLPADTSSEEIAARLPRLVRASVMQTELGRRVDTAAEFGVTVDPDAFTRNYPNRPRIMAVCENGPILSDLQQALLMAGFHAIPERSAFRAGERIDDERVDAAVIGVETAQDIDHAASLAGHIRTNPRLFNLPTLIIGDALDAESKHRLYQAGVSIVLPEPVVPSPDAGLIAYLHMLVNRQRWRWTMRDPFKATLADGTADTLLSGVYGPDVLTRHLARLVETRAARGGALSVGLVAIDNAAGVEDAHGAEAARVLMQQMANWIAGMTRIEDCVARLDANRFAVLMPETAAEEAERVLQRIAGILHQSEFHLTEEVMEAIHVWPSVGVAAARDGESPGDLLARAERTRL